jgi:homoserine O-acetyltransferase/O-succinyltransferase
MLGGDKGAVRAEGERDSIIFSSDKPLRLDSGARIEGLEIAYQTYGVLNAERSNAILVCHALTLDQHVASHHPATGKPGWWRSLVGPGLPLDPDRHFIVCSNVVGGCMGSTGPSSPGPTGAAWGLTFPMITIADMVRAQAMLVESLGIERLFAVIGGSMGGMQVLQWAADYPERIFAAVCIAAAARHSAQNIAFHEVGRQAIMADPDWRGGDYAAPGERRAAQPEKGLAVARMAAHITYLSEAALQRKFGRELQRDGLSWGFDADFQVESYLRHQGASFVDRFDANSYLYITRAMDYFDLAGAHGGVLADAFRKARDVRFCVFSFTSDWLYPTTESRAVVRALNAAGARVSFLEIDTDKGHDAFLLDEPVLRVALGGFLESAGQARGLG